MALDKTKYTTDTDRLERLKRYLNPVKTWSETEEDLLCQLLDFAGDKVLNQRYPFGTDLEDVPTRFQTVQLRIAAELYAKLGGQGESHHTENGITRTWDDADVAQGLLREIPPMIGV